MYNFLILQVQNLEIFFCPFQEPLQNIAAQLNTVSSLLCVKLKRLHRTFSLVAFSLLQVFCFPFYHKFNCYSLNCSFVVTKVRVSVRRVLLVFLKLWNLKKI
ncbi:unnamed protein product [Coffea canephora]|uniref:DH200=94 genomic scaffold, scaffold_339 n=1 Tax=Coffea canephora TaxID=49390 RepID=A0A068VDZ6_COFCA|nr:unnamed protein product [Coffea canephora]